MYDIGMGRKGFKSQNLEIPGGSRVKIAESPQGRGKFVDNSKGLISNNKRFHWGNTKSSGISTKYRKK